MSISSPITPKSAWSGRDNLDREDYAILEKIITAGRAMAAFGTDYKETQAYVEQGKIDIERYREKLPRGKTVEERDAILRKALITAYEVNPHGLVEAVAGGPASKPGQVVTQMAQEYGNGDPSFREELVGMVAMTLKDRYALDRMTPQFVNRVDRSGRSIAKVRGDEIKGRAASTDMISNWNPSAGGVVMYLRKMITTTCRPLVIENLNSRLDTVSLDAISDMGFEPVDKGNGERGFTRSRTNVDYEGGERIEEEETEMKGIDDVERESRQAARDRKRADVTRQLDKTDDIEAEEKAAAIESGEIAIDDDEDQIPEHDIDEEEHPAAAKPVVFEPGNPHRQDLCLIADCLEASNQLEAANDLRAAASEDSRFRMMKASVLALVTSAVNMEDRETVLEVAADWDPAQISLDQHLPEFRAHAEASNQRFEAPKPKASDVISQMMQLELFGAPDAAASPQEHMEHAEMVTEFAKLWREHPTPAELASPDRRDFRFLVHATGGEVSCPSDTKKRNEMMREMGLTLIRNAIGVSGATSAFDAVEKELSAGIQHWDPAKNFFSEMVCAKLAEMNNRGMLSPETVAGSILNAADVAVEQEAVQEDRKAKTFARRANLIEGDRDGMEIFGSTIEQETKRAEQNLAPTAENPGI